MYILLFVFFILGIGNLFKLKIVFEKKNVCYCRLCRIVRIDCKFLLVCLIVIVNEDCWICISD